MNLSSIRETESDTLDACTTPSFSSSWRRLRTARIMSPSRAPSRPRCALPSSVISRRPWGSYRQATCRAIPAARNTKPTRLWPHSGVTSRAHRFCTSRGSLRPSHTTTTATGLRLTRLSRPTRAIKKSASIEHFLRFVGEFSSASQRTRHQSRPPGTDRRDFAGRSRPGFYSVLA